MDRIGKDLLDESKAAATEGGGAYSKDPVWDKSLLSLLLRANMAKDLPEHQRLSEDEVLARTLSCHYFTSLLSLTLIKRYQPFSSQGTRRQVPR